MHGHAAVAEPSAYSFMERALHHLALGSKAVGEMSFDMDHLFMDEVTAVEAGPPVFVSGLARAGTTIVMRRLHETGRFRSLTYRDMPFVMAPNMWRKFSGNSKKDLALAERAHGDGLAVDADSPESLDEIFWRVFSGDRYIRENFLRPIKIDDELVGKFRQFVVAILAAQDDPQGHNRYLSKGNNNILRLEAIKRAFPEAVIIIPFRDPVQHAGSLLKQHQNFCRIQADDKFGRSYMKWLAHHEFGLEHKPFWFKAQADYQPSTHSPDALAYWVEQWCKAYEWLLQSRPAGSLLLCYEDLCTDATLWPKVLAHVGLPSEGGVGDTFTLAASHAGAGVDAPLLERANDLYGALKAGAAGDLA